MSNDEIEYKHPFAATAAELTADEWEAQVETCKEIHGRVLRGVEATRESAWYLANALYDLEETAGWSRLGYETKAEYLADPEVNVAPTVFNRLVAVWREFVVVRELEPSTLADVSIEKMSLTIAAVKEQKITPQQAVEDSRSLGLRDMREKFMKRTKKPEGPTVLKRTDGTEGSTDGLVDPITASGAPAKPAPVSENLATTPTSTSGQVEPHDVSPLDPDAQPDHDDEAEVVDAVVVTEEEVLLGLADVIPDNEQEIFNTAKAQQYESLYLALLDASTEVISTWQSLSTKRIPTVLNNAITQMGSIIDEQAS
jgi:hypothetical protein